jgi:glutaconate CoA-transferase subunit B
MNARQPGQPGGTDRRAQAVPPDAAGRAVPSGPQAAASQAAASQAAGSQAAGSQAAFSKSEMMIAAAARELAGKRVCFVGVGLPNIAVNLARRTVAPDLELVYEAGVFGAQPQRLPLSIGDPTIVTGSTAVMSMFELFAYYLQRGLVDVGFLGAAQIDRFGNINTTVIGDYAHPRTRLPGSGGACEIAINARNVFVIMRQSKRSFVEHIDFRTSPGNLGGADGARIRRAGGWNGRGPSVAVTDLGIYHFDDETGEMRLDSLHPGATLEQVRDAMGWEPRVAGTLETTPAPSAEELRLIREELDPQGIYTK